ncbi:MAG TPA: response regulator [Chitinispirillaceae bacterium]|nr:response regulator [Chitinispirillaceae bacterium]
MQKPSSSILIVDDEYEIREMISDYLRDSENYTVLEAESGPQALEILNNNKIDLVISDINMPGMKGFDLLKEIREKFPLVKRVLITAYDVENYLNMALKYDIGNIFVKTAPFNFSEFSSIISYLLNGDIFGLSHYFDESVSIKEIKIHSPKCLDKDAEAIIDQIGPIDQPRRLELVIVELLTNAIFYGIRNEMPDKKELWSHDFFLPDEQAIQVAVARDDEKYAISVSDPGGRLKKYDILYWLNRQISRNQDGLPLGLYDSHGRGFFIVRKYIDRLIINIDQARRTEIIIMNYFSRVYKGYKPLYINEI